MSELTYHRVNVRGQQVYEWYSTKEMADEILNLIHWWWLCQDAVAGAKARKATKEAT